MQRSRQARRRPAKSKAKIKFTAERWEPPDDRYYSSLKHHNWDEDYTTTGSVFLMLAMTGAANELEDAASLLAPTVNSFTTQFTSIAEYDEGPSATTSDTYPALSGATAVAPGFTLGTLVANLDGVSGYGEWTAASVQFDGLTSPAGGESIEGVFLVYSPIVATTQLNGMYPMAHIDTGGFGVGGIDPAGGNLIITWNAEGILQVQ